MQPFLARLSPAAYIYPTPWGAAVGRLRSNPSNLSLGNASEGTGKAKRDFPPPCAASRQRCEPKAEKRNDHPGKAAKSRSANRHLRALARLTESLLPPRRPQGHCGADARGRA